MLKVHSVHFDANFYSRTDHSSAHFIRKNLLHVFDRLSFPAKTVKKWHGCQNVDFASRKIVETCSYSFYLGVGLILWSVFNYFLIKSFAIRIISKALRGVKCTRPCSTIQTGKEITFEVCLTEMETSSSNEGRSKRTNVWVSETAVRGSSCGPEQTKWWKVRLHKATYPGR